MSIGSKIKFLRENAGLSQIELGNILQVSDKAVSTWENDLKIPRMGTLQALADYFGVTKSYIIEDGQSMPPVLTKKDERDIAKKMEEMLDLLSSSDPLMFDGEPLDDETKELLRASYENQLRMTKQIAKAKYTPKKYKK